MKHMWEVVTVVTGKSNSFLENKYADDRVVYTNGKQDMINKILEE